MKEETKQRLKKLRRIFVVGKFTLQRGYSLLNVPFLALMGAGVLYPYAVQYFPWIKMWSLAIIAFVGILGAGWLDRTLRLLHEEQTYSTETNPMMMEVVNDVRNKAEEQKEEESKEPKSI